MFQAIPTKSSLVTLRRITVEERHRLRALPDARPAAQQILWRVRRDVAPFLRRAQASCPGLRRHPDVIEDLTWFSDPLESYVLDGDLITVVPDGLARKCEAATAAEWRVAKIAEIIDFVTFLAFQRGVDLRPDALRALKALDCEPCGWIAGRPF